MQLKQISRILVQFSPWTGEARSAREFVKQITSDGARASNPDCKVDTRVVVKGPTFIEVEYENKNVERIDSGRLTVAQILERVQNTAEEMDTVAKLQKALGVQDPLASRPAGSEEQEWRESDLGYAKFIPRTS